MNVKRAELDVFYSVDKTEERKQLYGARLQNGPSKTRKERTVRVAERGGCSKKIGQIKHTP